MDEWQGALSPLQNLKWITHFLPLSSPPPPFLCSSLGTLMLFAANFSTVAFPACGSGINQTPFFFKHPCLTLTLSLFIQPTFPSPASLPFLCLSVLMIYFCKKKSDLSPPGDVSGFSKRSVSIISVSDRQHRKTHKGTVFHSNVCLFFSNDNFVALPTVRWRPS